MPRAKKGYKARRRRNKILKAASGFRGKRHSCYKVAKETVQHAWLHMYRTRRDRKGDFRRLWIVRINAAARLIGVSYSKLIGALAKAEVGLDRKILAEIAIADPKAFAAVAKLAGAAA